MSEFIPLEGTVYKYKLRPLSGHDVVEHHKQLSELEEFHEIVAFRVTDLVDEVATDDGRVVEDVMSLGWQDVIIPLAIACMRGLLPKPDIGTNTATSEA